MFGTTRTVAVRYRADVDGYMAGMRRMQSATSDFGKRAQSTAKSQSQEWGQVSTAMLAAGAALTVGLGMMVKRAADFEQGMSRVGAVTDASASQMKALSTAALEAGEDTIFSATEAAAAQEELAKAGVSTADILGGALKGSLDLAAAGGLDLASAAEIAAQSMNLFNLEGEDVTHIADVLTAAANKSAAGVDDLGQALQQGGTVAAATGLTLEETVGTLSAFADSGMKGSDAGTSLKTMLQRLNPTSDEAARTMKSLGISAYDAQGNFVGMEALAGQLQTSMAGLTNEQRNAAMATIFGSDAVRAANILYKEGAAGIAEYVSAVDDQGAAQRMAARMTDNLKGDLEELSGALETAFIKTGSGGTEGLRSIVQGVEGIVSAYNNLPPAAQSAAFNIAAVTAAALLLGGGAMKAVTAVGEFRGALTALGVTSATTAKAMAVLKGAFALVAVGYAVTELKRYTQAGELADVTTRDMSDGLRDLAAGSHEASGGLADMFRQHDQGVSALFRSEEGFVSAGEAVERFGFLANEATRTDFEGRVARWMEGTGAFDESVQTLDQSLAEMVATGDRAAAQDAFAKIMEGVDPGKVDEVKGKFVLFQEALDNTGPAAGAVREALSDVDKAIDSNSDGWVTATEEAEAAADALKQVQTALEMLGGGFRAEQAASRAVTDSLKEMHAVVKEGEGGWSTLSAAMDKSAADALSYAAAQAEMGRGSETIAAGLQRAREQVIQAGMDAGKSRAFMEDYADAIGLIPSEAKTMVEAAGVTESTANVLALDDSIMLLNGKTVTVKEEGASPSEGRVRKMDGAIFGLRGKTVKVEEIGATPSGDRVVRLDGKIYALRGKTVDVTAQVRGGAALANLQRQINSMSGRSINVNTYYNEYRRTVDMGTWKARAMGGIDGIQPMAEGGMRPTVAPGIYGTTKQGILMAEDTRSKWESYIPERPDLRPRAEAILAETARRFGKQVIPMASGGIHAARTYVAPSQSVTVQAPAQAAGATVARLHPDDAALLAAVAGRPVQVQIGQDRFYSAMVRAAQHMEGR